jgi:hypothetical protein
MRNRNEQNQANYAMDAMEVLCSAEADVFAKTLDALGWMIVPKPPFEGDRCASMSGRPTVPRGPIPRRPGRAAILR